MRPARRWWPLLSLWLSLAVQAADTTLAFPEAVGFGRHARGGRGGEVVAVTTLTDGGPGSLRAALHARRWQRGEVVPRTVVFRVAGTITLTAPLWIRDPYLTVAGQSAPGKGVALRTDGNFDGPALAIDSHDIVIRYLRIRPARAPEGSCCGDAVSILGGHDIILDHCSLSWGSDEVVGMWYRPRDITLQHNIIAEGRRASGEKIHGKGVLVGAHSDRVTLFGNLIAHQLQRSPMIRSDGPGLFQVVNNVIYNWRHLGGQYAGSPGPTRVNVVGNTYRPGPETRPERYEILISEGASVYLHDNRGPRRPVDSLPDWNMAGHQRPRYNQPAPAFLQAPRPFPAPALPVLPVEAAYERVLETVGASLPTRDSADRRLLYEVRERITRIDPPPDDAADWPVLAAGAPYPDTDRDGMDDRWELAHGLAPDDPTDRNHDPDGDGYTHLEEFLNITDPRQRASTSGGWPRPPVDDRIRSSDRHAEN